MNGPTVKDLPKPRQPRTKIPSVEVIVRNPGGSTLAMIGLLDSEGFVTESTAQILRALMRPAP